MGQGLTNVDRLTHLLTQVVLTSVTIFSPPANAGGSDSCYPNENPTNPPVFPDDAVAILSIDPHFPSHV